MSNDKYENTPSKGEIATYWADYLVKCNREEFDRYPNAMTADFGEPDCWACGRYDPHFNDIQEFLKIRGITKEDYNSDYRRYTFLMWEMASLERHHIIPLSLGGSDDSSNLCLLCLRCHEAAPHTDDADYFWNWAKNRQKDRLDLYIKCAREAMIMAGVQDEDFASVCIWLTFNIEKGGFPSTISPLHKEVSKICSSRLSYHPNADPVTLFRDELYHVMKYCKEKKWTKEFLERYQDDTSKKMYEFRELQYETMKKLEKGLSEDD